MTEFAARGSQRWLQIAVERNPDVLLEALRQPLRLALDETIYWKSPLRADGFAEYRDMEALRQVGIAKLPRRPLDEFWPQRGPVWDALGVTSRGVPVFVEAKANVPEMASNGTQAGESSLPLIEKSLAEARHFYAPRATAEWHRTFYQYANRLAHHYFLQQVNRLPSRLVFLYFLNADDVAGPSSRDGWRGAIQLLHAALGLTNTVPEAVHDVFVNVRDLATTNAAVSNEAVSMP